MSCLTFVHVWIHTFTQWILLHRASTYHVYHIIVSDMSRTRNLDQCPTWWLPCRIQVAPLFNAAKFAWRPLLECRAVTLLRSESRWNWKGCPKLANRSQPLVARSSPYYEDMWRRYCCLTYFFPIVDTCLSSEDIARQSCAIVPKWRFFAYCIFQRAAYSAFQTCILNSH